jgi:hypothetical protein
MSGMAVALAALVVVVALIIPLVFLEFRHVAVDEVTAVPSNGSGRLDLNLEASLGEVEVIFLPLDGDAVKVSATIRGRANFFGQGSPLRMDVTSQNITDEGGSSQFVNVSLNTYAPWPHYSLDQVNYTISVNEGLRSSLNITVTTGGVALATTRGTVLERLEINSTVKGARISLENGTVLAGDIRVHTATGGTMLWWNNLSVEGDRNVTLTESSGLINGRFVQQVPMTARVNVTTRDVLGEVRLAFDLVGNVSAEVRCVWQIGEPEVIDLGGFTGDPLSFHSINHPTGTLFAAEANCSLGNIAVEGRWVAALA